MKCDGVGRVKWLADVSFSVFPFSAVAIPSLHCPSPPKPQSLLWFLDSCVTDLESQVPCDIFPCFKLLEKGNIGEAVANSNRRRKQKGAEKKSLAMALI